MNLGIGIGPRLRKSPFFDKTVEVGVSHFTTYNHMLMPAGFGDVLAEYHRLTEGVAMWDVAAERQVVIKGRDAEKLVRYLTPRNLGEVRRITDEGNIQGRYVPLCDFQGRIINDPVLLPVEDDEYWLSIADTDVLLWARAIAGQGGYDVEIHEGDISPLAVQGPQAENVVADLCGDWIRSLKHFGFKSFELDGIALIVARSGWSHQGGFELYLRDGAKGDLLWDKVKAAGEPYDIGPGTPNMIERVESGLLSIGADTDDTCTPYEVGLGKFVSLKREDDFIGKAALQAHFDKGIERSFVGLYLSGDPLPRSNQHKWPVMHWDKQVGYVSAAAYSPRMENNVGVGVINNEAMTTASDLRVESEFGPLRLEPRGL